MGTNEENLGRINKTEKERALSFELIQVKSSRISGIGFMSPRTSNTVGKEFMDRGMVIIEFNNPKGSRYVYFNVKRSTFNQLKNADSIGKTFGELFLNKFEYERIS